MKLKKLICLFSMVLCANSTYTAARAGANPYGSSRVSTEESLEKRRLLAVQLDEESRAARDFLKDSVAAAQASSNWEADYKAATPAAKFGLFPRKMRTDSTSSSGSK